MSIENITLNKQHQKTTDFRVKYKTQRCRLFYEQGYCPFTKFCAFAHNQQEIREKREINLLYKTKPCSNFFINGFCKYGDRCQYLHAINQKHQIDSKSRSDIQETCSSKSSQHSTRKQQNQNRNEFKYRERVNFLEMNELEIIEILSNNHSKLKQILEFNEQLLRDRNSYTVQYDNSRGNAEKKLRMYSM